MRIMRLYHRLFLGVALIAALSACTQKPELDPSATVTGSPTRPEGFISDDDPFPLVDDENAFSDDLFNEGLSPRDPNFDILSGRQIRGQFPTIYFDFDQSFVRPADRPALDRVADQLRAQPADYLLVEGYCDWKGTTEYNLALGDRRATSVKDYLVSLGIDPSRIEILSKGDLDAAPDAGPEGRALDRKAELVIVRAD